MEGTIKSLWLLLLLNHLPNCPTDADQDPSTTPLYSHQAKDWNGSSTPAGDLTTINNIHSPDTDTSGTHGDCLIDTEMGLIAIGSAGVLIVCLLVATVVLACLVRQIQRQVYVPRQFRSNMDLMSSAGYWGIDRPEVRGQVGPCDASVVLEELRADSKVEEDRQAEIQEAKEEAKEEAWAGPVEGVLAIAFDPEDKTCHKPSSSSKDCCLEVPKDLEDTPLVV